MANETLRNLRRERRWTQAQTAQRVCDQVKSDTGHAPGLDAAWISRLERGVISWPSGDYRAALCTVFQVGSEAQLGLYPKAVAVTEPQGTEEHSGTPCARPEADELDSDAELSAHIARFAATTNVNALVFEQLDADLDRLARDFVSRPLPLLVPEIRDLRREVFRLLEGRQYPGQTRHLYVAAGWLCGLAAHISLDLGHQPSAATHARTVMQCADIAEHQGLRAWARSFQSLAAYWTGDYQRATDLARSGYQEGRPGPGTIRARLLSLEARALAAGGEYRGALRALALAQEARSVADSDELPGVFTFPEAKQWAYTGTTLLAVGGAQQVRRAITASTRAVELYQAGLDGDRSPGDLHAAHLDLATAHLTDGEMEGAAHELASVLAAPNYTASISTRLRNLYALMGNGSYRDARRVVDLREHIREAATRPALASNPTEPR